MHRALRPGGDVLALENLYNAGAVIDSVDEQGRTALYVASGSGYLDAVRWLLERGADPLIADFNGRTSIHAAAASGHASACEYLLDALDRTSAVRAMQAPDAAGKNPAEIAAAAQHVDVVRALLSAHTQYSRNEKHSDGTNTGKQDPPKRNTESDKLERVRQRGYAPMVQSPLRGSNDDNHVVNKDKTRWMTP